MAVVLLDSHITRYTGLSTDEKPQPYKLKLTGETLSAGSSFLETDTGRIWRFNGSEWTYAAGTDNEIMLDVLAEVVRELKTIREMLALVTASTE